MSLSALATSGHVTKSVAAAAAAKSYQSCPTLCNPIDSSPTGSSVPGILQARILEWVAIAFSNAWKWKVKVKLLSHVRLLVAPLAVAYQAPQSMGFSRQEYQSGLPLPSPESVATRPQTHSHSELQLFWLHNNWGPIVPKENDSEMRPFWTPFPLLCSHKLRISSDLNKEIFG